MQSRYIAKVIAQWKKNMMVLEDVHPLWPLGDRAAHYGKHLSTL